LEAGTAALKTEWGAAFEQNLGLAKKALAHYGNPALTAELERTGLGNSPELAKVMAKLGGQLSEDNLIGRNTAPDGDRINSPTEAKQQISALRGDKEFLKAYADNKHPGHADAVAKMTKLYEQAHPTVA
jgi:hypothetical protein